MEDMEVTPPWCDETFFDEMAEWWDSPEGSLWLDMLSELEEPVLKDVGLDAQQRKFLWPDAGPLDLDQSARRINQQYPDFPKDKIKEFLIYWIQHGYEPKGYSESQMDELERLTEQWAEEVNPGEPRLYVPSLRRLTLDVRIEGYPDGPGRALCKEDEP
jgi:hypothetical protein